MEAKVNSFLHEHGLANSQSRVLVAVSGGVDSMVLASICHKLQIPIAVAHCNFQLRSDAADGDEEVVRKWASENEIACYCRRIETKKLAESSNRSIQMVARDERYGFFDELMDEHGFTVTALAHHADDRIESLLLNVLRGTGIRGLQGMPDRRNRFVRPLLAVTKHEIRLYAEKHGVRFREDGSNQHADYQRNRVRLHLLPMLRQMIPDVDKQLQRFVERAGNALPNALQFLHEEKDKLVAHGNADEISVTKISEYRFPFTVLKEWLGPEGFSSEQIFQVLSLLSSSTGSFVSSRKSEVVRNRDSLLLTRTSHDDSMPELNFEVIDRNELSTLNCPSTTALVDASTVNISELKLMCWKEGDRFKPLGMRGWKKLSDFFIDEKLSRPEKDLVRFLTFKGRIVWVVGMRLDDRFKVRTQTTSVLKISLK